MSGSQVGSPRNKGGPPVVLDEYTQLEAEMKSSLYLGKYDAVIVDVESTMKRLAGSRSRRKELAKHYKMNRLDLVAKDNKEALYQQKLMQLESDGRTDEIEALRKEHLAELHRLHYGEPQQQNQSPQRPRGSISDITELRTTSAKRKHGNKRGQPAQNRGVTALVATTVLQRRRDDRQEKTFKDVDKLKKTKPPEPDNMDFLFDIGGYDQKDPFADDSFGSSDSDDDAQRHKWGDLYSFRDRISASHHTQGSAAPKSIAAMAGYLAEKRRKAKAGTSGVLAPPSSDNHSHLAHRERMAHLADIASEWEGKRGIFGSTKELRRALHSGIRQSQEAVNVRQITSAAKERVIRKRCGESALSAASRIASARSSRGRVAQAPCPPATTRPPKTARPFTAGQYEFPRPPGHTVPTTSRTAPTSAALTARGTRAVHQPAEAGQVSPVKGMTASERSELLKALDVEFSAISYLEGSRESLSDVAGQSGEPTAMGTNDVANEAAVVGETDSKTFVTQQHDMADQGSLVCQQQPSPQRARVPPKFVAMESLMVNGEGPSTLHYRLGSARDRRDEKNNERARRATLAANTLVSVPRPVKSAKSARTGLKAAVDEEAASAKFQLVVENGIRLEGILDKADKSREQFCQRARNEIDRALVTQDNFLPQRAGFMEDFFDDTADAMTSSRAFLRRSRGHIARLAASHDSVERLALMNRYVDDLHGFAETNIQPVPPQLPELIASLRKSIADYDGRLTKTQFSNLVLNHFDSPELLMAHVRQLLLLISAVFSMDERDVREWITRKTDRIVNRNVDDLVEQLGGGPSKDSIRLRVRVKSATKVPVPANGLDPGFSVRLETDIKSVTTNIVHGMQPIWNENFTMYARSRLRPLFVTLIDNGRVCSKGGQPLQTLGRFGKKYNLSIPVTTANESRSTIHIIVEVLRPQKISSSGKA